MYYRLSIVSILLSYLCLLTTPLSAQFTSQGLQITEGAVILDDYYLKINAEVKNTSTNTYFGSVKLLIYLYDASGQQIEVQRIDVMGRTSASDAVYISTGILPPGCTSPARRVRDIKKIQGKVASHRLEVQGLPMRSPKMAIIKNVSAQRLSHSYKITAEYHCLEGNCTNPGFVVAAYDASGKIIHAYNYNLSKTENIRSLSAGQSYTFRDRTFYPMGIDIKQVDQIRVFPKLEPE